MKMMLAAVGLLGLLLCTNESGNFLINILGLVLYGGAVWAYIKRVEARKKLIKRKFRPWARNHKNTPKEK